MGKSAQLICAKILVITFKFYKWVNNTKFLITVWILFTYRNEFEYGLFTLDW